MDNNCLSYKIENVTPTDYFFKMYAPYYTCYFQYLILCTEIDPGDNCTSITFNNSPNLNSTFINAMSNETSRLFTVAITTSIGNHSTTINSIYTIDVECYSLDLNKVEFKQNSNGYFYMFDGGSYSVKLRSYFKFIGDVNPEVSLHGIRGNDYKYYSRIENIYFSSNYVFEYSSTLRTDLNLSAFSFTFNNGIKKDFPINPIGKGIFDNIYDIKTYPDVKYLNDLQLFGLYESAMIQFTSNNTALSNSYTMNINGQSTTTSITPIYGDENSTTYLYLLKQFESPSNLYELYYINDAEFKKSSLSLTNINITNYQVDSYRVDTGSYNLDLNTIPMISFGFYDNKTMKDFPPLFISSYVSIVVNYPFGFSLVTPFEYKINISMPISKSSNDNQNLQLYSAVDSSGYSFTFEYNTSISLNYSLGPVVYDYEFIRIVEDVYIIRIHIKSPYGFNRMQVVQNLCLYYGKEILVSGDLYDGVYEIISITISDIIIQIYDNYNLGFTLSSPYYMSLSPSLKVFISPAYMKNANLLAMYDVSFLYNDIDVTNRRHYNVMYFSLPDNFPKDYQVGILPINSAFLATPVITSNPIDSEKMFFNSWNTTLQKHQIEFYVDANTQVGIYSFWLLFNLKVLNSESLDGQLRIKKSKMDLFGPKFRKIKKIIPSSTISKSGSNKIGTIGWSIEIEDPINGFDNGYFVITGELDKSMYNITINSNDVKVGGNIYLGEYDITLNISAPCISQNYIITEVVLYDRVSRISTFYTVSTSSLYSGVTNPFIYFLNDSSINKVPLSCAIDPIASLDTTPPVLTSFSVSKQILDVSASNREIIFTFTATDIESGIKTQLNPSVYLTVANLACHQCKSTILSSNSTSITYSCITSVPISFGYPGGILISIYNLVNNNGYSSGYSSSQLLELGFPYYINTTFDTNEPSINGHYKFKSTGGDLFLFGRCLDSTLKVYLVNYQNITTSITPIIISSTVIKVPNVKATDKKFKVYIKTSTFTSNTITVTPMIYDYYLPIPEPTFPPTVTPVPTNAPQSCPGKPECGGPSNGKCITNQGCVCYSPWIGIDCLSQIIVVNPPIINTGNNSNSNGSSDDNASGSPSIEIIVPGVVNNNTNSNNGNNSTPITYSSLISIVALREIDINGGVVKSYTFKENWLSRQLDTLTYAFYTFIEGEDNQSTNVTAILKWFTNETTIKFANEELIMNPSSMKYTIEISNYPFQNGLNELQLVMSALIQSNTTENVCSSKEFGETTQGDNSNYLKIQVDNHSLYGRFIRRGIIDSNIRTITNTLLDKDMNPITSTTSLQSYIGIQIPNHKDLAIIDPDFSVILDSYSASSKSNSICSNKSKLSAAKIAGIAVGATAFAAVIGISLTYYFKKKIEENKFLSSVNKRMEEINKDSL